MHSEHAKPCPITTDAQRAVAEAQHARKAKTIRRAGHGEVSMSAINPMAKPARLSQATKSPPSSL